MSAPAWVVALLRALDGPCERWFVDEHYAWYRPDGSGGGNLISRRNGIDVYIRRDDLGVWIANGKRFLEVRGKGAGRMPIPFLWRGAVWRAFRRMQGRKVEMMGRLAGGEG